jgi:DNA polymerase I
LEDEEKGK